MPASNVQFWAEKLIANRERDQKKIESLIDCGWRVLVVWECLIRSEKNLAKIGGNLERWLLSSETFTEFPEVPPSVPPRELSE